MALLIGVGAGRRSRGWWSVEDIEPGTYTSQGSAGGNPNLECVWFRLRGPAGRDVDVIDSGRSSGPMTVTIMTTDKGFVTGGCGEWVGPAASPG